MGKIARFNSADGSPVYATLDLGSDQSDIWVEFRCRYNAAAATASAETITIYSAVPTYLFDWALADDIPSDEWHVFEFHFGGGNFDSFIDGVSFGSGGPIVGDVRLLRIGPLIGSGDPGIQMYVDDFKVGTTRHGANLFSDDFEDGSLAAWELEGDVSIVDESCDTITMNELECDDLTFEPPTTLGTPGITPTLYAVKHVDLPGPGNFDVTDLYTVDPETAVLTSVGPTGFQVMALAWDSANDVMYGITAETDESRPSALVRISRETGEATYVGDLGVTIDDGSDIACDANGNLFLFWLDQIGSESGVYTVNKATGAATFIGDGTPTNDGLTTGLAFDGDGILWGFDYDEMYVFDPDTGVTTVISQSPSSGGVEQTDIHAASVDRDGGMWVVYAPDTNNKRILATVGMPPPVPFGDPSFTPVPIDDDGFLNQYLEGIEWVWRDEVEGSEGCDDLDFDTREPLPDPLPVPLHVRYVDFNGGDDDNDGLSRGTAWKTIHGGANDWGDEYFHGEQIGPGYEYRLRGTTPDEGNGLELLDTVNHPGLAGTVEHPIVFTSWNVVTDRALVKYEFVTGLQTAANSVDGNLGWDDHHLILHGLDFDFPGGSVTYGDHLTVTDCTVAPGSQLLTYGDHHLIDRCTINGGVSNAAPYLHYGTALTIRNSIFLIEDGAANTYPWELHLDGDPDFGATIVNNTIVGWRLNGSWNSVGIIIQGSQGGGFGVVIRNNLFADIANVGAPEDEVGLWYVEPTCIPIEVDHNVFAADVVGFDPGAFYRNEYAADPDLSDEVIVFDVATDVFDADPDFAGAGDFHIGAESDARLVADESVLPLFDRDGIPRTEADAGAYGFPAEGDPVCDVLTFSSQVML